MKPADVLDQFSVQINELPLSEIRNDDRIRDSNNPIAIVMLVLDYLTEVEMNGILNFFGNSTGRYPDETVAALEAIGCNREAKILGEMTELARAAGLNYEHFQREAAGLQEFEITNRAELYGTKWTDTASTAAKSLDEMAAQIDHQELAQKIEAFVERHLTHFMAALDATN